jgi:hypothetical protein
MSTLRAGGRRQDAYATGGRMQARCLCYRSADHKKKSFTFRGMKWNGDGTKGVKHGTKGVKHGTKCVKYGTECVIFGTVWDESLMVLLGYYHHSEERKPRFFARFSHWRPRPWGIAIYSESCRKTATESKKRHRPSQKRRASQEYANDSKLRILALFQIIYSLTDGDRLPSVDV